MIPRSMLDTRCFSDGGAVRCDRVGCDSIMLPYKSEMPSLGVSKVVAQGWGDDVPISAQPAVIVPEVAVVPPPSPVECELPRAAFPVVADLSVPTECELQRAALTTTNPRHAAKSTRRQRAKRAKQNPVAPRVTSLPACHVDYYSAPRAPISMTSADELAAIRSRLTREGQEAITSFRRARRTRAANNRMRRSIYLHKKDRVVAILAPYFERVKQRAILHRLEAEADPTPEGLAAVDRIRTLQEEISSRYAAIVAHHRARKARARVLREREERRYVNRLLRPRHATVIMMDGWAEGIAGLAPPQEELDTEACREAALLFQKEEVQDFFLYPKHPLADTARIARKVQALWKFLPFPAYYESGGIFEANADDLPAFEAHLDAELESLKVHANTRQAHSMFAWASGLATASAAAVATWKARTFDFGATTRGITKGIMDSILEYARESFFKCLAPFTGALSRVSGEIEKYWRMAKGWVESFLSSSSVVIEALNEASAYALIAIIVCGIVLIIECLLMYAGIISVRFVILPAFYYSFITYSGFFGLATFMYKRKDLYDSIVNTLKHIMFTMVGAEVTKWCVDPPDGFSTNRSRARGGSGNLHQAHADGLMSGLIASMGAIGNGLCSSPLKTMHCLGKLGQTLDSLRKGKDCMKEFLAWSCDTIADMWDGITGKRETFFREISHLTRHGILEWITKAQELIVRSHVTSPSQKFFLETVTAQYLSGLDLQNGLAGARKSTSVDYGRLVTSLVQELGKIRQNCARSGVHCGRRMEPFWVYIYGEPHCGKSLFMEPVTHALLEEYGYDPGDIYAKSARDQYWSGYMRNAAIQVDDLSATEAHPSLESEFIQLVGSKEYRLNMAAVEDKGMLFDSSILVTSSNVFEAPTCAGILDRHAYNTRRGAVIQCRRAEGVEFDPSNSYASCEARFVDNSTAEPEQWMNCMNLLDELKLRAAKHRDVQLMLQDRFTTTFRRGNQEFMDARKFLRSSCNSYVSRESMVHLDGKVYWVNGPEGSPNGTQELIGGEGSSEYSEDAESLSIAYVDHWKDRLDYDKGAGGYASGFLEELLDTKHCYVSSVHSLDSRATSQQKTFFNLLDLEERIYLRLLQKRMDAIRNHPALGFKISVRDMVVNAIRAGYERVKEDGGRIVVILLVTILIYFLGYKFFTLLKGFCSGGNATASAAAALACVAELDAHAQFSSSSSETSFRSRNTPIVYRQHKAHGSNSVDVNDFDFCTTLLVRIDVPMLGIICACRYKGRSVLLTQHQAEQIPNGIRVRLVYTNSRGEGSSIEHIWRSENIRTYEKTEIVVYAHPSLSPLPAAKESLFCDDYQQLPTNLIINGAGIKPAKYLKNASCDFADGDEPVLNTWTGTHARVCTEVQCIVTNIGDRAYRNDIPISLLSNCPTTINDCGAIITTMHRGRRVVIAIHVAGSMNGGQHQSVACFLPYYNEVEAHSGLDFIPEAGVVLPGVSKIGFIPDIRARPHYVAVSQYKAVPEEFRYEPPKLIETLPSGNTIKVEVEIKMPSILAKNDKRLADGPNRAYDPLKQGMEKFSQPMDLLDDALLKETADEIVDEWKDLGPDLHDVPLDVAINGNTEEFYDPLVMNTSEGYPWVCGRGMGERGKGRFFVQDDTNPEKRKLREDTDVYVAYKALHRSIEHNVPQLVCVETPKDECLPLRKVITKPKTRLFSILPLEFNLVLREKYLDFVAFLQRNRRTLSCQVGVNPYSREWQHMYHRIASKNDVAINCDYSSFDGLMSFQMVNCIADMINELYINDTATSKKARKNLLLAIINRWSLCGSQVYEVLCGIPSGCSLTVILNSVFNEILVRYTYKLLVGDIPRHRFSTYVCLLVYGDDNIISVHQDIAALFTGARIKETMATFGVNITDGSDKMAPTINEKPLGDLDFLKRRFSPRENGQVYAPLDLSSLYSQLQNVTLGAGSILESLKLNVEVCLVELYLHQNRDWFDHLRSFYVRVCDWSDLMTWQAVQAFHAQQITGATPWQPHRMLEVQQDVLYLQQAMSNQGLADYCAPLAARIMVVGTRYRCTKVGQFVVSTTPLFKEEFAHGVYVPISFGQGRGRLPTQQWVRNFRRPGDVLVRPIKDAYDRGDTIYFRGAPPYIDNWCAAISFAQGVGLDYEAMIHAYNNVCTPGSASIELYFRRNLGVPTGAYKDRVYRTVHS